MNTEQEPGGMRPEGPRTCDPVPAVIEWFLANGGKLQGLEVIHASAEEGHVVRVTEDILQGKILLAVPFRLMMSKDKAENEPLMAKVVASLPPNTLEDDILALLLLYERSKAAASFWNPYIRSLPAEFDLPIFWDETDYALLEETQVHLLTKMMKAQMEKDYQHLVIPAFQTLCPDHIPSYSDYLWAMSVIWSRAFGLERNGRYVRALAPVMDMFNHHPLAGTSLDDHVHFEEDSDALLAVTNASQEQGSILNINYGPYPNAKLLYSYGFTIEGNPHRGVEFWLRLPPTDPYRTAKEDLLKSLGATYQNFDLKGTIRGDSLLDSLMIALRVQCMNIEEFPLVTRLNERRPLSVRNELAAYKVLQSALQSKVAKYPSSIADDLKLLRATDLTRRQRSAILVRLEDKMVLTQMVSTLSTWIRRVEVEGLTEDVPRVFSYP